MPVAAEVVAEVAPRRPRADAVRNRALLIAAARRVFAERGLEVSLDDIAAAAGVNVATAYRNFANKHELIDAFLQDCIEEAVAQIEAAAAVEDPERAFLAWIEGSVRQMSANRGLLDVLKNASAAGIIEQFHDRMTGPLQLLLQRAQAASVVRADLTVVDLYVALGMMSGVVELFAGAPGELWRRQLAVLVSGLRPDGSDLPERALGEAEFRVSAAAATARR